jgi:hypothetical protein
MHFNKYLAWWWLFRVETYRSTYYKPKLFNCIYSFIFWFDQAARHEEIQGCKGRDPCHCMRWMWLVNLSTGRSIHRNSWIGRWIRATDGLDDGREPVPKKNISLRREQSSTSKHLIDESLHRLGVPWPPSIVYVTIRQISLSVLTYFIVVEAQLQENEKKKFVIKEDQTVPYEKPQTIPVAVRSKA